MPRPRPPHLHRESTRHGKIVWYVRIARGPRIRIRAAFGTPGFDVAYQSAIEGRSLAEPPRASPASLQWLWDSYRQTGAWSSLRPATRRQRENIMLHVLKESGTSPYAAIKQKHIVAGIDRRSKTPAQARNFLDVMKGLFRWAAERGHVAVDPTLGVKTPKRKRGDGFPSWTEDDVEAYQRRWPLRTRQRVWLDVLLYTGLRRGDAVRVGKQHVRDGVATIRTEKSGETVEVTIPILDVLQQTLDAGPTGDLAWICGDRGQPLSKETFGNEFSAAARAAGVKKSAHGVRKIAATTAANAGATVHELEAIFGWSGGSMASLYTRKADRARLSKQAIQKLARGTDAAHSIPAPRRKVRAPAKKAQ